MVRATYSTTYTNRVPYITIAELKGSPTASELDYSNLIPSGNQLAQDAALQDLITRASVKADNYCLGALGTLSATVENENGRIFADRMNRFSVHPAYWPVLELRSFKVGPQPGKGLIDIPLSDDNCFIERHEFFVTPGPLWASSSGALTTMASFSTYKEQYCEYTYVNGFANTFLSANAAVGATSVAVLSSVALYPGQAFTLYAGATTETVVVADAYDGVSLTIPLKAALLNAHTKGENFSAIPPTVKQAVIHFVVAMVKQRGQGGLVINEMGEPTTVTSEVVTSMQDEALAYDLLDDFRQVWGRQ